MNMKDIISYDDIKTTLKQDTEFLNINKYKNITALKRIRASASDCKYALFGYALELLSLNDIIDVITQQENANATNVINYTKDFLNSDRYIKPDTLIRSKYLIKVYWGDTENAKSYSDEANIEYEARAIWYEYFSEVDTAVFVNNGFLNSSDSSNDEPSKPSISKSFLCINNTLPTMLTEDIALYSLLINNALKQLNTNQKDLLAKLYPNKTPLVLWNYRDTFLEFLDVLSKRTIHY